MRGRALFFVEPRAVQIRDVDVSEPEAGEVLIRTAFSGISGGTEMLAYRGELDADMPRDETLGSLGGTFRYPFAYGYAAAGTVERSRGALPEGADVLAFHPHQDRFVVAGQQGAHVALDVGVNDLQGHGRLPVGSAGIVVQSFR